LAGLASGWLVIALETVARGGAGAWMGFSWQGVVLQPPFGLPLVLQGMEGSHGAGSWAVFLLAGPLAALAVGTVAHVVVEMAGAPDWLRALGFEAFAIAWLRFPLLLLAAGVPGGRGPLALLYERVGEPESGRWAAIALGMVILWGVAALVAWRAVALGRDWLRVDGRGFRRRVVRLVAAYPFLLATAAFEVQSPLAPLGWLVVALALVLGCLTLRTP
jgi:hypothetical protein